MSKTNKKKVRKWIIILFTFLLSIGGATFYMVYQGVAQSLHNMYAPLHKDKKTTEAKDIKNDPISILLLGIDERPGDNGRPDSMIVLTMNPKTKESTMVSIPRDTRVFMKAKNDYIKMNSSYTYGGIEGTIQTAEDFLNIPINYYVKVNMQGFEDIIDTLGGITINNNFAFTLEGIHIDKGTQHLDGKVALQYARMRKDDPRGDFGRQERQREIIKQIIHEGTKLKSITNYQDILAILEKNVQTNISMEKMIDIQSSYKEAFEHIKQEEIKGIDKKVDGIWFHLITEENRHILSQKLRKEMNLKD
ncbi:LCP family protein [Bacillus safensis]|uniref:LCP family glycopolymer transferase n=1 Tax=Bacillus safensis TaxID=561879 RepID=UPI0037FAAD9C